MVTRSHDKERDILVLKYLKDHRVLSIDQIARRFWGSDIRSSKAKMLQLADRGLVQPVKIAFLRATCLYALTRQGFSLLKSNGYTFEQEKSRSSQPVQSITGNFEHHSRVADLRIAFETEFSDKLVKWIPEIVIWQDQYQFGLRELERRDKRQRSRIPDGIIVMNGESTVFEYEHASYRRGKFYQIIGTWEGPWENYNKLIVTPTQERAAELTKWCKEGLLNYQRRYGHLRSIDLRQVAAKYRFMSYESIMKFGFVKSAAFSPLTNN